MLEKFMRYINRNAYVVCAIYGKNFCSSARDAFFLLLRNVVRVAVLDNVIITFVNSILPSLLAALIELNVDKITISVNISLLIGYQLFTYWILIIS